jgi:hypothetical protein
MAKNEISDGSSTATKKKAALTKLKMKNIRVNQKFLLGSDSTVAQAVFECAAETVGPDALSQRKALGPLVPSITALRVKGVSWKQITELLVKCGFKLTENTARVYYGALLAGPQAVISATTKEPNTAVMATIAKLKAASDEVRTAASAAKLNEVFVARAALVRRDGWHRP